MSTQDKLAQALRIKFENWALDQSNITSEENCLARDRIDGRYVYRHVETAWRAYLTAHDDQVQAVPDPVGVVTALNVCGEPMPNSSGVEWLRPIQLGTKLYAAPQPEAAPAEFVRENQIEAAWKRGYGVGRATAGDALSSEEAWGMWAASVIHDVDALAPAQPEAAQAPSDEQIEAIFCEQFGIDGPVCEQERTIFVGCRWYKRGYRAALAAQHAAPQPEAVPVAHVLFRQDADGLEPVMFYGPGTAPDPATLKDRFILRDVWLSAQHAAPQPEAVQLKPEIKSAFDKADIAPSDSIESIFEEGWRAAKASQAINFRGARRRDAAEATLKHLGYEWCGGELWKPPLGKAPDFALAAQQADRAHGIGKDQS
ncbi:MAG: hypothetical protein ACOVPA_20380 [Rubrivivax sp.]